MTQAQKKTPVQQQGNQGTPEEEQLGQQLGHAKPKDWGKTFYLGALGAAALAAGAFGVKSIFDKLPPKPVERPAVTAPAEKPPEKKVFLQVSGEQLITVDQAKQSGKAFYAFGYHGTFSEGRTADYIKGMSLRLGGSGQIYSAPVVEEPKTEVERELAREWKAVQHVLTYDRVNPQNKPVWFNPDFYKAVLGDLPRAEQKWDTFRSMLVLKEQRVLEHYQNAAQNGFPGGTYVLPKDDENVANILFNMHGLKLPNGVSVKTNQEASMSAEEYKKAEDDLTKQFGKKQKFSYKTGAGSIQMEGWTDTENGLIYLSPGVVVQDADPLPGFVNEKGQLVVKYPDGKTQVIGGVRLPGKDGNYRQNLRGMLDEKIQAHEAASARQAADAQKKAIADAEAAARKKVADEQAADAAKKAEQQARDEAAKKAKDAADAKDPAKKADKEVDLLKRQAELQRQRNELQRQRVEGQRVDVESVDAELQRVQKLLELRRTRGY